MGRSDLLERLVVHEAGRILRDVELALLYVLAELPARPSVVTTLIWCANIAYIVRAVVPGCERVRIGEPY